MIRKEFGKTGKEKKKETIELEESRWQTTVELSDWQMKGEKKEVNEENEGTKPFKECWSEKLEMIVICLGDFPLKTVRDNLNLYGREKKEKENSYSSILLYLDILIHFFLLYFCLM